MRALAGSRCFSTASTTLSARHSSLVLPLRRPYSKAAGDSTLEFPQFKLTKDFVESHRGIRPSFGYQGLGELVYRRTYSRIKPDGKNENWAETVERVVNGTFSMQRRLIAGVQWDEARAQRSAQEMYRRIFEMKFLPPGRGLWAMGSPLTEERHVYAALNNCAFVSTSDMKDHPSKPFTFLMDASMLGVGCGFDTSGANVPLIVKGLDTSKPSRGYKVADSREGWVDSVRILIDAYYNHDAPIDFDYSQIRALGAPIKGFGGVASGPKPLQALHDYIHQILGRHVNETISITGIVDIMNVIGRCVIAGNVRQTAEIAFGPADLPEYLDLKNYEVNPGRQSFGWTSNNSVIAKIGMDYRPIVDRIVINGEPGLFWLENAQKFSRMCDPPDNKDVRALGGNPCLEQTLESYELCCLVETFPAKHTSLEDYKQTLKYAFLYAKTVTLGEVHWPETKAVMSRNRRIGTSMSGIVQFINEHGKDELKRWCNEGYDFIQAYDKRLSEFMKIPRSIKTTSVKPSGTVSLLAGATPGMHWPIAEFYIRRIRMAKISDLLTPLLLAGYRHEPSYDDPENTVVVEFPVHAGKGIRKEADVSMWEQLELAAFLQREWSDNQVSSTVKFDIRREKAELIPALEHFQHKLKGVSFLPSNDDHITYQQMPYEEISEEDYYRREKMIRPIEFEKHAKASSPTPTKFCDNDFCEVDPEEPITSL